MVTGSSRRLGRAIAGAVLAAGHQLVAIGRWRVVVIGHFAVGATSNIRRSRG
jgi:NAD(P)-dependent dehydrogenase (short-subunit alcohol dehydrogenase family)